MIRIFEDGVELIRLREGGGGPGGELDEDGGETYGKGVKNV